METVQDIYNAMEAAYAAGNKAKARKFAQLLLEIDGEVQAPKKKPESGLFGSLGRAAESLVSSNVTGVQSLFGDATKAGKEGEEREAGIKERYGESRVGLDRLKEVYQKEGLLAGAKELATQVPHALAEQAPNFAQAIAGGRAGALLGTPFGPVGSAIGAGVGAVGALAVPQLGGNVERQVKEAPEAPVDMGRAGAAAVIQGGAEAVGSAIPLGKNLIGKLLGPRVEALLAKGNVEAAEALAKETLPKVLAKGAAKGTVADVPAELIQTAAERWQAGLSLTDAAAQKEYIDTAYQAALVGPAVGAAGRYADRGAAQERVAARDEQQRAAAAEQARRDAEAKAPAEAEAPQSPLTLPEGGPGRPTFLQAQRDIFGGEQPNAPDAAEPVVPEARKAELTQQIRTLEDLLEERRAAVSAAASPEDSLKAAAQFKQVEAALKQATAEHAGIKIEASPEEKLAKLYAAWQKAKETGDVDQIARYAQRIAEMKEAGVQSPASFPVSSKEPTKGRAMKKQAEMPMQDFTGKSESRSEFFPRVNANELNQPTATEAQESGDTYVPPPPPPEPPAPLNTGRTDQLSLLNTTPQIRTVVNRGEGAAPAESREELVAQLKAARATRNNGLVQEIVDKLRAMQAYTPEASKEPGGVLAHRVSPTTSAPTVETTYTSDKAPDAEAIRTAVAQLPEKLNPYYDTLATRIQQNADAIASNPENASMVSGLLYQMRTNPMPGGNAQTAQVRDVTDMLDTLEQGKRSETEALPRGEIRTAVQTDMFPEAGTSMREHMLLPGLQGPTKDTPVPEGKGVLFATKEEFLKYLSGKALDAVRKSLGLTTETAARIARRIAPLQRKIDRLEQNIKAEKQKYEEARQRYDAAQSDIRVITRDTAADQAHEAAQQRLAAVKAQLDAELEPLRGELRAAEDAFWETDEHINDILDTIDANNTALFVLPRPKEQQLLQALRIAHATLREYKQATATKENWDAMRSQQKVIATLSGKLASVYSGPDTAIGSFLQKNKVLTERLTRETETLASLYAAVEEARVQLETSPEFKRITRNQKRRVGLARAEAEVAETRTAVEEAQKAAEERAASVPRTTEPEPKDTELRALRTELDVAKSRLQTLTKQVSDMRKEKTPGTSETQSEREARDGEKRKAQQAALERAEADTFVVSFEGQSKMRQLLDDAPEALERLEFMRQEAMDEGDRKAYKSLSTRINKLKNKVDLYTDLLNGGTEAQAKLVERMRKQQEKIEKLKANLAAAETPRQRKSRRDSLTEAEKIQRNMFHALQGQRGIAYNPKKPEKLETEAPVAGTRLGERAVGPIVRNTVFPGNIRTGTEESKAGENKTKTTTKAAQSTAKPRSARAITAEEQAEANRIGEEIRSKPVEDVEEKPVPKRAKSKAASALDDIYADETFDDYTRTTEEERTASLTALDETAAAAVRDGKVETLLKHLSENAKNPLHRELAERLLPLVTGTKLTIRRNLKDRNGNTLEGIYRYDTNTVEMNPVYLTEETVLHELLHAATVQVIQRPASQRTAAQNAAVRELEGMYAAMKANPKFKDQLAVENLAEFVAEVYTNKPLRDAMDSVGKPTSLLQRFWNAVKRMFGFGDKSPSGKAIDAINEIMDESQAKRMEEGPTTYTRTATSGKKTGMAERMADFGLAMETMVADMRAPLVRALERLGDANAATQALFDLRQADRTIPLLGSFMDAGAPVMRKDEKGLRYIQAGDGPSGVTVLSTASKIPGKTAEERFRKATDYMLGLQAERLGYERFGSNADRIKALMAEVKSDAKLKDSLEAFRKVYNQYNEALVRMVQQTGAISKEDADAYLKNGDYVPRYRERNGQLEMAFGDMGYQRVGDIKHTPFLHSFKGGEELILPINETLLHNTMLLTNIATTNMAKRNIGYAFSAMGKDAKKMQVRSVKKGGAVPSGPTYITWKEEPRSAEDSGDRYIEVDTEDTPLEDMDPHLLVHSMEATPIVMPAIVNVMSKLNDYLRAGISRTPIYVVRQLLRDPMSAASVTGMKDGPFTAVAKTLRDYVKSFTGNETIAELNKKALVQSPLMHGSMDDLEKLTLQFGTTGSVGTVRKLLNTLDKFALNADAATRAQVWKDSKARGMSDVEAMLRVMESMNFQKRGASADIQYLTRMIPFLNSSIQAINTAVTTLRGKAPFEKRVRARRTFVHNMIMLGITGFAYSAYMHDADEEEQDEKYGKLPVGDRFGNIHIRVGEHMLKLPIGYAESGGLAWALGQALFETNKENADTKRIGKALAGYVATGTPGGVSLTGDSGVALPTGLKQYIEWTTNIDTRTFLPIVPQRLQNRIAEEQFTPDTPSAYVAVGQTLGLSPVKLQRLIDSLVGSIASDALTVLDRIEGGGAGKPVKPEATPETTPFLRSFFQKTSREDAINNLYELAERSKKVHTTYLSIGRERPQDLQQFLLKHREEMALRSVLGGFEKAMGDASNRIRMVQAHPTMDAATKKERVKFFEDQREQLAQNYLQAVQRIRTNLERAAQ